MKTTGKLRSGAFFLGSETNHNDILYIYKCTGLIQESLLKRCISFQ